jgi:hypothetical protein
MLADKTNRYQGRNTNLESLRDNLVRYLQDDGFKVQVAGPNQLGMLIQAQKGGFLRELITAERSLNILIQGEPNNFTVRVGVGKWIQNIAVATVEVLLISDLFLPLDVGEMIWNVEVERTVMKKVDELVGVVPAMTAMGPTMTTEGVKMEQPIMEVVQKDGTTIVTSESKIVKGRVERVTGAGHFVVYPGDKESADVVKTGDQVMVLTDMKLYLDITMEVVREPIIAPYPVSEFAIDLKGRNRQLQTCTVYCKGEQLFTIDSNGAPKYEVQLPLGGTLRFHIPDTLKPLQGSIVEVREGEITIYETFDVIPGANAAISLTPTV